MLLYRIYWQTNIFGVVRLLKLVFENIPSLNLSLDMVKYFDLQFYNCNTVI